MFNPRSQKIKREKKKSLFLREITMLVQSLGADNAVVALAYVTRIDFSADYGMCYVYFSTFNECSEEIFNKVLDQLKLYRPSMRKALAARIPSRYTPDLVFFYDKTKEKEIKINQLLDKVSQDLTESQAEDAKNS